MAARGGPIAPSFCSISARGSGTSAPHENNLGTATKWATVTAAAAAAAATSQKMPLNSVCICGGRKFSAAMLDDLLVTIIGENKVAPPNRAASRAVTAGPRNGSFRPATMSR